jgi:hypothetical protein
MAGLTPRLTLHSIAAETVPSLWEHVVGWLAPAIGMTQGCFEASDVLGALTEGRQQLWLLSRGDSAVAAVVTQIIQYPRRTVLFVPFMGGRDVLRGLGTVMRELEAWAMAQGCDAVQATGRKGWVKAGAFRQSGAMLWKDL